MRLASFIRANTKPIIQEWESFAMTLMPAAQSNSPLALRDHIQGILTFIAADIESAQTESERIKKSHGNKPKSAKTTAAETHASVRLAGGFNMDQMVSEYRALRSSVVRLWEEQLPKKTVLDIADQTRFNEAIDQELAESIRHYTRKLDYSRNLFLGILGHDLRNPLSAARMSAELTLKMGSLNERQTMLNTQVVESTDRALEIVEHLLDLTKARLGSGLPVVKEPMDMGFVSKVIVDEMRALHLNRTFTLNVTGDTEGEWDKPRIGQVLSNLLGNAVQYSFSDSPIDITVVAHKNKVTLAVHNKGVPIPPETIGRIFSSLTRGETGEEDDVPGSVNLGLGLFIVKEIVTAHGGTIDVTSTEKDGTLFTAKFPRSHVLAYSNHNSKPSKLHLAVDDSSH